MKVSAAAVLATTAAIGVAHAADVNPLIVSGTIVPAGTKTYQVGLRMSATSGSECGGTLITPTHVLSAAHCAGFAKFISIGSHFRSGASDGERIAVKKEIIHPKYIDDFVVTYDYSILELESPSKFTPVKLFSADSETFVGTNATVMGWGTIKQGGASSNELLRVNVPVRSDKDCKAMVRSRPITESMFCAGGELRKDSCQGDSGGPLILERPTGDVQIGVVSWGEGCGDLNKPGVYSKVSHVKDWILSLAPGAQFV
jgi:secreted trypsin-like serine protease